MLTRFAVKNYRGFKDRLEWDFSHPGQYSFNNEAVKGGVIKNAIVYGPNGAGKSNLGLAVFDIANHLSHKWKKPDYYINFASAYSPAEPVEFEYRLVLGGSVLDYSYAKVVEDMKGVLIRERLAVDGREMLFRDAGSLRLSDEFALSETAKSNLLHSANNISLVNYLLGGVPLKGGHPLLLLSRFAEGMLFFRSLDNREFIGLKEGGSNIEEYIINNGLADDFAVFLREISGQEFTFAAPAKGDKMLYCIIGDTRIPFIIVASTGTMNLELQYYWLKEMEDASFVFVDEFDAFYHHKLADAVSRRLFRSGHQVFLTTHDTSLLSNDLLRPDCYFILDGGAIKPLCALTEKELRLGHNLEKLYRGGAFGA